jgi:hypothetical protein
MKAKKVISRRYAMQLVNQGKARIIGRLIPDQYGIVYVAIDRIDLQITQHFIY